jgi:hypothetical protein
MLSVALSARGSMALRPFPGEITDRIGMRVRPYPA